MIASLSVGLLAVGCSSPDEPARPIDVAQQKLDEFISDGTLVAGFSIGQNAVTVVSGVPPQQQNLYKQSGEIGSPIKIPAHPPVVRGSVFPLAASVDRARELEEQCDDWRSITVRALSDLAVVTRASCSRDGEIRHTVLLNDHTLPTIDDPINTEALQTIWSETGTAGLGKHLLRVEIDRSADQASVFFTGAEKKRTYEWSRGLSEPNSLTLSHPIPPPVLPREQTTPLGAVGVEQVTAALDEALAGLDELESAERITVEPTKDGGGIQLVLTALDYTPLATVPVTA